MKKFKDLIYDYNDIVLAIIIIIVAGAVIFWKVSDIMAYPTFAKNQDNNTQSEVEIDPSSLEKTDVDPIVAPGADIEGQEENQGGSETQQGGESQGQTQSGSETQPQTGLTKDVKFTVPSGYVSSKIATKLENEGICKAEDFTSAVTTLNAETKLRAGDFTIPAGSTAEDIVKIIANIR